MKSDLKKVTLARLFSIVIIGGSATAYAIYAAKNNNQRRDDILKRSNSFTVGSIDDMLMDSLKTGDILLFTRKWNNYPLLLAAMIRLNQSLFGEPDHCGIVILDELGTPLIFETTPWGRPSLRRFDSRISASQSCCIELLSWTPADQSNSRGEISEKGARRMLEFAKDVSSSEVGSYMGSQIEGQGRIILKYLLRSLLSIGKASEIPMWSHDLEVTNAALLAGGMTLSVNDSPSDISVISIPYFLSSQPKIIRADKKSPMGLFSRRITIRTS